MKILSADDKYGFFFEKMKEEPSEITSEILDKIAGLMAIELNIDWEQLSKIKFFLELAACAREN